MAKTQEHKGLEGLQFVEGGPRNLVQIPGLLSDPNLIRVLFQVYKKVVAEEYADNSALIKLDQLGRGSNPFIAGLVKKILMPYGVRSAISADDKDGKISGMVKDDYYTDFVDLVVHSPKHTCPKNKKLLKDLIETVEDRVKGVKFPFKITGVIPILWGQDVEKGYGLRFTPAEDFDYVSDGRLNLPTGTKFDKVDDKGILIPDEEGKRTWYSKQEGLSRLSLDRDLGLYSNWDFLAGSLSSGRVVLVGGEATANQK